MDGSSGGATLQLGMLPLFSNMEEYMMHLLNTKVTPDLIHTYTIKHAFFSRCSFYIEIIPKYPDNHITPSVPTGHPVDPQKLECVKQDAKTQVRVQLALQIELLKKLKRNRENIANIATKISLGYIVREEDDIYSKMSGLLDAAAEFEDSLLLGAVHNRHKLLFEAIDAVVPQIHLELKIKKPVIFNRPSCVAYSKVAFLHWSIEDQEQHEPGEQFQIQYKILDPDINDASNQSLTLTCKLYNIKIDDLMPGTSYEFTIKRVDSCLLVYSIWADVIWLKTLSDC